MNVRLKWRRAVTAAVMLRDACLGGPRKVQAPVPRFVGAAFGVRTPIAEFMPRLRGTALEARVPVAEFRPRTRGTALERRLTRAFSSSKKIPG